MNNKRILKDPQVIHRKSEKDKQSKEKQTKKKTEKNNKMCNLKTSIATITLKVNVLNISIRSRMGFFVVFVGCLFVF